MEAVARQQQNRLRSAPEESGALARVAALTCKLMDVDEAAILLGASDPLNPAAVHGCSRSGALRLWTASESPVADALLTGLPTATAATHRRPSAAAPLILDDGPAGVLLVRGTSPLRRREQLEILADLAALAADAVTERALRVRAEAALDAGVDVLARAVDVRDEYTGRHSADVGSLARRVGERLGMGDAELATLEFAARLHDVGKLGVPDAILQKPGPLEEHEWAIMRRHAEWGAEMVSSVPGLERLADLVRFHHERWDGAGYPAGLAGERIPLASRVISACDAFSAMVSRRPYREPFSVDEAVAELLASAGTQFDPKVVQAVQEEAGRD